MPQPSAAPCTPRPQALPCLIGHEAERAAVYKHRACNTASTPLPSRDNAALAALAPWPDPQANKYTRGKLSPTRRSGRS